MNKINEQEGKKPCTIYGVRRSFIGRLLCLIGWHRFSYKIQDCINEFGYIPNDGRMPKVAKCSRCGKNYS